MKHYPYLQHLLGICLCLGTLFVSGQDKVNVEGSWEMIRFIDHANQGTDWIERPAKVIKQKHITDTHFSWFEYDSENNELIGMGGGTYIIDENNNYVENINFFLFSEPF